MPPHQVPHPNDRVGVQIGDEEIIGAGHALTIVHMDPEWLAEQRDALIVAVSPARRAIQAAAEVLKAPRTA